MRRVGLAFFGALLAVTPLSGQAISNPGFELRKKSAQTLPSGWDAGGEGYVVAVDSLVAYEGASSLRVRRAGEGRFAVAMQVLTVDELRGRTVRLSGFIRTEDVEGGYAGLWLRVEGPGGVLAFDNMMDRGAKGSSAWTSFSIVRPVDDAAERVVLGTIMTGAGTAWFDGLTLDTLTATEADGPSPVAEAYLDEALDVMRAHAFRRDSVDWSALRERALGDAAGARVSGDTYGAIRNALRGLGDGHSFLQTPTEAEAWETRSADAAASGTTLHAELLNGGVGYVRVPGFWSGSPGEAVSFARTVQDRIAGLDPGATCGWVLDLRDNVGGNMWPMVAGIGPILGEGIAGFFIGLDGSRTSWGYASGAALLDGEARITVGEAYVLSNDPPAIAVLTGPRTASSGEAVTISFRGRPRTRSFGEGTAGLSTANGSFMLSDGARLLLTTSVMADRTGQVYGAVVPPDEVVPIPPEGTPLPDDPVIIRARHWLAEQPACTTTRRPGRSPFPWITWDSASLLVGLTRPLTRDTDDAAVRHAG